MHVISRITLYVLLVSLFTVLASPAVKAETISFAGTFTGDDEVRLFDLRNRLKMRYHFLVNRLSMRRVMTM